MLKLMVIVMRVLKLAIVGSAIALAMAATPASATPIKANTTYTWTLGGVRSGAGQLTTGSAHAGGFDIASFTGVINGSVIAGLLGGQPGGQTLSPLGAFYYDNIIYSSTQMFDINGVLFTIAGGLEANIWGVGPASFSYYTGNGPGSYSTRIDGSETFAVRVVPEPFTLSLFGAGLIGLGAIGVRKRKFAS
ncbi:MAG: PEP-CTERM sorting domain-containing protein [Rhizomicrobium sp.]